MKRQVYTLNRGKGNLNDVVNTDLYRLVDETFEASDLSFALSAKEDKSNKGINNGYAPLDSGGKIPLSHLPSTLLKYVGVWDASTNTPTLTNPDLTKVGNVYNVSVVGTQFGINFKLGDWLIYNELGVPEKSDNSDDVVSVNGQTGVVTLNADNIAESATRKWVSPSEKDFWNAKQPLLTNPITGTGTTDRLSKFTSAGVIGNSILQEVSTNAKGIAIQNVTPTNTSFGYSVLSSASLSGAANTGFGHNILNLLTTGSNNSAFGYDVLKILTNGNNNTAFGFNCLSALSTGSENSSFGYLCFNNLTSGSANVTFGVGAARFIADGTTALTTCNQSIFLGNLTKALANSSTNEIVIGHNTTGAGSNTATLGNTSITKTILRGAVQIGAAVGGTDAVQLQQLPKRQKEVKYKFTGAVTQNTLFGDNFQEFLYQGYNLKKVTVVFGEQSMNVNKTIPILVSLLDTDSAAPSSSLAYTANCNAVVGLVYNKVYTFDINVALTSAKLLTVGTGAFTASTQILNNCLVTLVLEEI